MTRDNVVVNRLNKTKVEKEVDHESERQERLRAEGRKKKASAIEQVGIGCMLGEKRLELEAGSQSGQVREAVCQYLPPQRNSFSLSDAPIFLNRG